MICEDSVFMTLAQWNFITFSFRKEWVNYTKFEWDFFSSQKMKRWLLVLKLHIQNHLIFHLLTSKMLTEIRCPRENLDIFSLPFSLPSHLHLSLGSHCAMLEKGYLPYMGYQYTPFETTLTMTTEYYWGNFPHKFP